MVCGEGGYFIESSKPTQHVSGREKWQVAWFTLGLDFDIKMFQIDFEAFHRVVARIFLWNKFDLKSAISVSDLYSPKMLLLSDLPVYFLEVNIKKGL